MELAELVRHAVEGATSFIEAAGHELTVTVPDEPAYLEADPNRLTQVLTNLLHNSARCTPAGGKISLTVERQGREVLLTVADNGVGLPADEIEEIFEMFTQIDQPTEQGSGGLGIGLNLVKSLVELHGGSVEATSDGRDRGSVFRVRLPAAEKAPLAGNEPSEPQCREPDKSGRRVLVVDDNVSAAKVLSLFMSKLGHEVRTAHDGEEAVAAAEEFRPEVVLMDIGMPRMDGHQAARAIREQPWGKSMRLVALTGWGMDEDKLKSKQAGFDHHLVKPAEISKLRKVIAEAK